MNIESLNSDLQDEALSLRGSYFTDDEEKAEELNTFFGRVYELCEEVAPYIEGE